MIVISSPTPQNSAHIRCFVREPCSTNLYRRCQNPACGLWSNASALCCSKSPCLLAFVDPSKNEGIHELAASKANFDPLWLAAAVHDPCGSAKLSRYHAFIYPSFG